MPKHIVRHKKHLSVSIGSKTITFIGKISQKFGGHLRFLLISSISIAHNLYQMNCLPLYKRLDKTKLILCDISMSSIVN